MSRASPTLFDRRTAMKRSRNAASSAKGASSASRSGSSSTPGPMASMMSSVRPGLAWNSHRRKVMPLVLLLIFSG